MSKFIVTYQSQGKLRVKPLFAINASSALTTAEMLVGKTGIVVSIVKSP